MPDFRERTDEFAAIASVFSQKQQQENGETRRRNDTPSESGSSLAVRTHFTMMASELGKDIHRTSEKLQRLAGLAKTTSLFTEQSAGPEIQRLIVEVNRDIQRMATELDTLQADVKARNNGAKSQDADHHNNVVSYLKAQVGQTTAMFKDVLQTRTDNLKTQAEKKKSLSSSSVSLLSGSERSTSNPLYRGTAFFNESASSENESDVALQMPDMAVAQQSNYYRLRADAVRQIEQSMVQLQSIYTQLAGMVQEQDEMLNTIDHNIDDAVLNVSETHNILSKQLSRISKNRWLIMKVLGVLFVTVILFFFFFL